MNKNKEMGVEREPFVLAEREHYIVSFLIAIIVGTYTGISVLIHLGLGKLEVEIPPIVVALAPAAIFVVMVITSIRAIGQTKSEANAKLKRALEIATDGISGAATSTILSDHGSFLFHFRGLVENPDNEYHQKGLSGQLAIICNCLAKLRQLGRLEATGRINDLILEYLRLPSSRFQIKEGKRPKFMIRLSEITKRLEAANEAATEF